MEFKFLYKNHIVVDNTKLILTSLIILLSLSESVIQIQAFNSQHEQLNILTAAQSQQKAIEEFDNNIVQEGITKKLIYINQCLPSSHPSDLNVNNIEQSKKHPEDDLEEATNVVEEERIEFSTNTTIFRLKIMDIPLKCMNGQKPTPYLAKEEETVDVDAQRHSGLDDDEYYYDDFDDDDNEIEPNAELIIRNESMRLKSSSKTAGYKSNKNINDDDDENGIARADLYVISNGKLQIGNKYFNLEDYCVVRLNGINTKVLVCDSNCLPSSPQTIRQQPCLRKCCEFGSTFDTSFGDCVKSARNFDWKPIFYHNNNNRSDSVSDDNDNLDDTKNNNDTTTNIVEIQPQFYINLPFDCSNGYDIWPFEFKNNTELQVLQEYTKIHLMSDGSIQYLSRSRKWQILDGHDEEFCIDSGELLTNLSQVQMIVKCRHTSYVDEIKVLIIILLSLFIAACICLVLIAIIFIPLWDSTNPMHSAAVLVEIFSFLLYYITLTVIYYLVLTIKSSYWIIGTDYCLTIAVLSHFTYISIFSWMAVLSYDFWNTFKNNSESTANNLISTDVATNNMLRAFFYILFGFGVPGLIIGFGIIMDHFYSDHESGILAPEYGKYYTCSLSRWAEGAYTYFPVGIIYLVSLIFLIKTFYIINNGTEASIRNKILWKQPPTVDDDNDGDGAEGTISLRTRTSNRTTKSNLKLKRFKYGWYRTFFKICILIGLSWIVQIISYIVFHFKSNEGDSTISDIESSLIYIFISDLILGLQPIAIFIIFICKQNLWFEYKRKYTFCEKIDKHFNKLSQNSSSINLIKRNSKGSYTVSSAVAETSGGAFVGSEDHTRNNTTTVNEIGTSEEKMSMVCFNRNDDDESFSSYDVLDGGNNDNGNKESISSSSIEAISFKYLSDIDRETNV